MIKAFPKKINATYKSLIVAAGFCLSLLLVRMKLAHNLFFAFLAWNLFLAAIPYGITQLMIYFSKSQNSIIQAGCLFIAWLLFLPNSPYIITDLIHLHNPNSNWVWLDLFLVFAFALTGLLFGLFSLIDMHGFIGKVFSKKTASTVILAVCFLCGYGIYLGRFLRFNSWDILTRPVALLTEMEMSLFKPKVWAMTLLFGGLFWILFLLLKSFEEKSKLESNGTISVKKS